MIAMNKGLLYQDRLCRSVTSLCVKLYCNVAYPKDCYQENVEQRKNQDVTKIIKTAIIGTPNAGKSTLINHLVGRRICSISSKIHTTRHNARAVTNRGNTQIVFLDTPGLVSAEEIQKYNLECSFLDDGESAISQADVIGVLHDLDNRWTRHKLDPKVLRLLKLYEHKPSFLMMNKIDVIKTKQQLLDLIGKLTNQKLQREIKKIDKTPAEVSEISIKKFIRNQEGWENFNEVFLISALKGDGISDVMEYLIHLSQPGAWLFPAESFTDTKPEDIIIQTVKAQLLENLPNEIPYNLNVSMDFYEERLEGRIVTVVTINCKTARIKKLVMGPRGQRIRRIAVGAEQDLTNAFLQPVKLKLSVEPS